MYYQVTRLSRVSAHHAYVVRGMHVHNIIIVGINAEVLENTNIGMSCIHHIVRYIIIVRLFLENLIVNVNYS